MNDRLVEVKAFIEQNFVSCGIFFTRNWVGDYMSTIYEKDGVTIDLCCSWQYFEVFGLTEDEEIELAEHYEMLLRNHWERNAEREEEE